MEASMARVLEAFDDFWWSESKEVFDNEIEAHCREAFVAGWRARARKDDDGGPVPIP